MVDTATTKAVPAAAAHATRQGYWRGVLRRLLRDPGGVVVGVVILLLLALALFGPWLIVKDPYQTSMFLRLKPIGSDGFPLGSDELGRDMLSRLILGTRLSLFMGIVPVVFAFFIGGAIGIIAGYTGGKTNTVIMRTVDVFYAFPSVLLAIALSGALGAGIGNALLSLTLVFVPQVARIAESVTAQVRHMDYIDAARATCASVGRLRINTGTARSRATCSLGSVALLPLFLLINTSMRRCANNRRSSSMRNGPRAPITSQRAVPG